MAFKRQVKNFVKNYSDAEIKVREATSNDPWAPSSSLMLAISDLTFNTISLSEIMNMLWQRLNDHGKNWRHVYKSLMLLDYLIKNGSKEVIQFCIEGFYNLKMLKDFQHIDEAGKDQGYYIREKSKQVISLLIDEQLLHKEREVPCRTRQRSSYPVTCSERLPGTGNSPTAWASDPTPEVPASEKKCKLLKFSKLRKKKNTPKAESKQERRQSLQLPSEMVVSQGAGPLKCAAWKSAEVLLPGRRLTYKSVDLVSEGSRRSPERPQVSEGTCRWRSTALGGFPTPVTEETVLPSAYPSAYLKTKGCRRRRSASKSAVVFLTPGHGRDIFKP
ncbi:ENTH domain-containing protein 1 [Glossophaga mutica]